MNIGTATASPSHKDEDRSPQTDTILVGLASMGHPNLPLGELVQSDLHDEYEDELKVMADVRAYFQVAYRVSEGICDMD